MNTIQHKHRAKVNVKAVFAQAAADRTPVQTATRRLCYRLYRERLNPPSLRANLDHVVGSAMRILHQQDIRTTPGSVEICLRYIAQDGMKNDPLRQAIVKTLEEA